MPVGIAALVPLALYWVFCGLVLGAVYLVPRLLPVALRARFRGVRSGLTEAWSALRPATVATAIFALGSLLVFLNTWTFIPETFRALDALFVGDVEQAVATSILGPESNAHHQRHGLNAAVISFLLGLAVWYVFPRLEQEALLEEVGAVRVMKVASILLIVSSILLVTLPRRVIWESYQLVDYQGRQAFVIGEKGDDVLLFAPRGDGEHYFRTRASDPELIRRGVSHRLFDQTVE